MVPHYARCCTLRSFERNRKIDACVTSGPSIHKIADEQNSIAAINIAGFEKPAGFFVVSVDVAHDHSSARVHRAPSDWWFRIELVLNHPICFSAVMIIIESATLSLEITRHRSLQSVTHPAAVFIS